MIFFRPIIKLSCLYIQFDDILNILMANYWFCQKEAAIINLNVGQDTGEVDNLKVDNLDVKVKNVRIQFYFSEIKFSAIWFVSFVALLV